LIGLDADVRDAREELELYSAVAHGSYSNFIEDPMHQTASTSTTWKNGDTIK
jgi:hypothetical protein